MRSEYRTHAVLLCCTQSDAIQIQRCLRSDLINGTVTRPPRRNAEMPCSWGVQIATEDADRAQRSLRGSLIRWYWMED